MERNNFKGIAILTLHCVNNYGSILQTFGLFNFLEQNKMSPIVVDYIPKRLQLSSLALNTNIKWPLKTVAICIKFFAGFISRKKNYKFLRNYVRLSYKRYYSYEMLKKHPPNAKIFLTGSDQVWNSEHNKGIDKAYFLGFVPSNAICISYAASFGKKKLKDNEKMITKQLLSKFNKISVREKEGINIVKELGIKDPVQMIDPVFLLKKEEWYSFLKDTHDLTPYLVIYEVNNENLDTLIEYGTIIANRLGLKIYFIKTTQKTNRLRNIDKVLKNLTPIQFLQVLKDAHYIVTGSFHGTAFSLIFNKQFIAVAPLRFSNRLVSVLDIFNLKERLFIKDFSSAIAFKKIDYQYVNLIMNEERQKAKAYFDSLDI